MADVQVNSPGPVVDREPGAGPGTWLAIILALSIGAAIVWFVLVSRPAAPASAPSNAAPTVVLTTVPGSINIKNNGGASSAPAATAAPSGSNSAPAATVAPSGASGT